jgi:hypothetical protein
MVTLVIQATKAQTQRLTNLMLLVIAPFINPNVKRETGTAAG